MRLLRPLSAVCAVLLLGCTTQTSTVRTTPAALGLASEERIQLEVTAGPAGGPPPDLYAVPEGDPQIAPALIVPELKQELVARLSSDGRFQVRAQAPARLEVRLTQYALQVVETRGSVGTPEYTLKGTAQAQVVVKKGEEQLLDRQLSAAEQLFASREYATTEEITTVQRQLVQSLGAQIAALVRQ